MTDEKERLPEAVDALKVEDLDRTLGDERRLLARLLAAFGALPLKFQMLAIAVLIGGVGRLTGVDEALLRPLFTYDVPAGKIPPAGRCSGASPADVDAERADMEAIDR